MAKRSSLKAETPRLHGSHRSADSAGPAVPSPPPRRPRRPVTFGLEPRPAPNATALAAFERAVRALHLHDYVGAKTGFQEVIDGFPGETALVERAVVYRDLSIRSADRQPAPPARTVEERLTLATAALNAGDDHSAESLVRSVLREDDRQDLAHYLLAAIEAHRGHEAEALSSLARAFTLRPDLRAQAIHDDDLVTLHQDARFKALTAPPVPDRPAPQERTPRHRGKRPIDN